MPTYAHLLRHACCQSLLCGKGTTRRCSAERCGMLSHIAWDTGGRARGGKREMTMATHGEMGWDWSSIRASSFGERLRHLRKDRPVPHQLEDDTPFCRVHGSRLSVSTLCGCMTVHGYRVGLRTYRDVEAGRCLPDDAVLFLDVVSQCLHLTDSDVEDLLRQLSYDILRDALGDMLTWEVFTRGEAEPGRGHTEL
jgi:hypothetical protein